MSIRVLRLDLDSGPVELHPRLTVIDARDKPRRKGVVRALAAVSSGTYPGIGGVIEAQGILLNLDADTLQLLDLDQPLDNVVKADELTGWDSDSETDPQTERDQGVSEPDELVEARDAHADAVQAAAVAAGALAAARAGRDPFASTALDIARARLAALEAGHPDAVAGDRVPPDEHTIETMRARTNELEAALLALDAVDPFPVRIALDQLGSSAANRAPRAEAETVAAELAALDRELAGDTTGDGPSPLLDVAQQRLDDARDALFAAERAVRVPEVDHEVTDRLEERHGRVLKAEQRSHKRFRRRTARSRLERARDEERALLDGVGFPTYADFMMGTSIAHAPPEAEAELERARRELSDAEDMVAALAADADAALAHAALVARRAQLQDRAAELHADHEPTAKLRAALESAGFVFDIAPTPEAVLTELASVWLEEQRDVAVHRRRVEEELVEIERRLAAMSPADDIETHEAAVADARAAVAAAEVRLARHRDAAEDVARRQAAYYTLVTDEAGAAARVTQLEQRGPSRPAPAVASTRNGSEQDVDWHLLTRVAGVRSASYAGSVPLVLDRALDGLPPEVVATSLERLERLSSTVQTVVVTWDEGVLRWAAGLSGERAAFIR